MASRGRGRGHSDIARRTDPGKKIPKSIGELAKYLHSLDERNLDVYGKEFAGMVYGYSINEAKTTEVVELVFDTAVASRDYSVLGSSVCEYIIHKGPGHASNFASTFLRVLLIRFQSEVENSKKIRDKSIEHWLGIFAFLCEIYHKIKVNGEPITVVGTSILQIIDTMLDNPDAIDDEIDTICTKLKVCGKSLEEQDAVSMKNVMDTLRRHVIRSKSSCQRRCLIMEVIELKQLGWTDKTGNLNKFYADALADAIVEDEVGC